MMRSLWEFWCAPQRPADADDARLLLGEAYTDTGLMLMMRGPCETRITPRPADADDACSLRCTEAS